MRWGRIVVILVVALMLVMAMSGSALAATFKDVAPSDWFAPAVGHLADEDVIEGFTDGTFRPYDTVTRAQFASMMARALQPPPATTEPFLDVYSVDWFYGSVASLYQAGLISGTSSTRFSPGSPIARQQAASMVIRALAYRLKTFPQEGIDLDMTASEVEAWLAGFKDRPYIAGVHRSSVANAYRLYIVSGTKDAHFYPLSTLTRAQAAAILYQALYVPLASRAQPPTPVPIEIIYPTLRVGSRGPFVKELETKLSKLKYLVGTVDEVYDERTRDGVMAFQKVEGLSRDGQAGSQTWKRLATARTPALRLSAGGNRVEVDLRRQVLFLVQGGSIAKILPISSGKSGWATPRGHFRIIRKIGGWRESSLGLLYKPSYFYQGYAIHGSRSVPSYPASHGCVRTPMWATDALYSQLPIGMAVDVYY